MTFQFVDPISEPQDIAWLSQVFLTPLMTPTPIATRLPDVNSTSDTQNGFIRIEEAGNVKYGYWQWDQTFFIHAYSDDEDQCADISAQAVGYCAAARGVRILTCNVIGVMAATGGQRLTDPNVNLLRYRSVVTWRLPGIIRTPPGS